MAGGNNLGSYGGLTNNPIIDLGTLCAQASPIPGVLNGTLHTPMSTTYPSLILVGSAKRKPGMNFDGTPAEDMMYADKPAKSAALLKDPLFTQPDATLNNYMRNLMTALSIGDMEKVALEMHKRFTSGTGESYSSKLLDAEIYNNPAFVKYHYAFLKELTPALKQALYNPINIKPLSMNLLNFSSFWDKVGGLGITIHQVWSAKAELTNYQLENSGRHWMCTLKYTFYDHFGLDWEDIEKHGNDMIPSPYTGDQFKAWYILQHYRSAKPFITVMRRSVFLSGHIS